MTRILPLLLFSTTLIFSTESNETTLKDITIYGIRNNLSSSFETKKINDAVVDAISAEDIGKFPDKNIAESLSRLPGITISREFGEGQGVAIRGIQSSQNITQLNGQALGTAQWFSLNHAERNFNYEMLSSEMIAGVVVYKSSQAELDEGALGGTIILNTYEPLKLKAGTFKSSIEMNYGDMAKELDPSGSFLYSWKNKESTFGILVSASLQNRTVRREATEVFGFVDPADSKLDESFHAPSGATKRGIVPFAMGSALFKQERERIGTDLNVQWKPIDNITTSLHYFTSKLNADNQNQNFIAFVSKGLNNTDKPANGTVDNGLVTHLDVSANALEFDNIFRKGSKMQTDSLNYKLAYDDNTSKFIMQIGQTVGKGVNNDNIYIFRPFNTKNSSDFQFYNSSQGPRVDYSMNDWIQNPRDEMQLKSVIYARTRTKDKEQYLQFDYAYYIDAFSFNELKFGGKFRKRSFRQNRTIQRLKNGSLGIAGDFTNGTYTVNHNTSHGSVTTYDINQAHAEEAFLNTPNCNAVPEGQLCRNFTFLKRASFNIEEEISALYTMASFEGQSFHGNVGMRYVNTDSTSNAFDLNLNTLTPISQKNSYDYWLPSFNYVYELNKDTLLRFSTSKVITRPAIYQLTSAVTLTPETSSGSGGNPDLKPLHANQYEISSEWYADDSSFLGASLFYKNIKDFIFDNIASETINGNYYERISRPRNGSSIALKGVELNMHYQLSNSFGVLANYTYIDIDKAKIDTLKNDIKIRRKITLPFTSKNAYNLSLYYENDTWSGQLSYNYRSKFFKRIDRIGEIWGNSQAQLDAKYVYHLNPNWSLTLEALNLSNEKIKETYISPSDISLTANQWDNGRRVYAGFTYKY